MNPFERPLPSFRLVTTQWGDDLQAVAAREMGDANRWIELVWLNGLTYPYITQDSRLVSGSVILAGALLKVPSPVGTFTDGAERGQVYERDVQMSDRQMSAGSDGDLNVLRGADNLRQQLLHRVTTPRGQARRHPDYGCLAWRLLGTVNGPVAGAMAAQYVKSALQADYRVASVSQSIAVVNGDSIKITATASAIEGGVVDITNQGN
jgi:phage baseplate assembly protein W